jgi:hypothetical protein
VAFGKPSRRERGQVQVTSSFRARQAVLELRPHVLVRSGPARIGCFASRRAARDQADVAEHRQPARSGACSDGSEQTPAWKMDCSVTGGVWYCARLAVAV